MDPVDSPALARFGTFLILFCSLSVMNAQPIDPATDPVKKLYRWRGDRFYQTESSFGLLPAIQTGSHLSLGLGLSRGWFTSGEGGGNSFLVTAGAEVYPFRQWIAPYANVRISGFAFFFGGSASVTGTWVHAQDGSAWLIRPQVGLGYLKVFLEYGYSFQVAGTLDEVRPHVVSLSYYHTILPPKRKG